MQITVDASGVHMALRLLGQSISLSKFHARCIAEVEKMRLRNFDSQGELLQAGGWKPLKAATIARRRKGPKANNSTQILRDTGALMNSQGWRIVADADHGELTSTAVGFGGVTYGIYHHQHDVTGKKIPGKGIMPERRILPLPDQAEPVCKRVGDIMIQDAIEAAAKAAMSATGGI